MRTDAKPMYRLSIDLDVDVYEKVEKECYIDKTTKRAVVMRALNSYFKAKPAPKTKGRK